MVAARGLCSESGSSGDDSDGGSIGDAAEEGVVFPDDVDAPAPSLPPPPVSPPLPHPNLAGYVYIDPADPRTCVGRLTKFRGQQAMRCYAHQGCSWILPCSLTLSSENLIRWALARRALEVRTKVDHFRFRADFSFGGRVG